MFDHAIRHIPGIRNSLAGGFLTALDSPGTWRDRVRRTRRPWTRLRSADRNGSMNETLV